MNDTHAKLGVVNTERTGWMVNPTRKIEGQAFAHLRVEDLRLLRSLLFQWLSYDFVMLCLLNLISKPCHGCPWVALDILFPS